jgi:anti-sigma regulatory factor (Ser/Thr protein kinase)
MPADVEQYTRDVDLASLRSFRDDVTAYGGERGLTDLTLVKFVMAVYEIAANAVHHGGGIGRVRIWDDEGGRWCEVVDHGRGVPAAYRDNEPRPRDRRISGWGLWLTRQICTEVRITAGPTGSTVLLRFPSTDGAASAPNGAW